jgi:hypothetical protein
MHNTKASELVKSCCTIQRPLNLLVMLSYSPCYVQPCSGYVRCRKSVFQEAHVAAYGHEVSEP